jgi:hypothetical protein
MDKHATPEESLSEEQLQHITGGCGACEQDKIAREQWKDEAAISLWLAEGAAAKGNLRGAKAHGEDYKDMIALARARQASIDARHTDEPANKRQRLQ